MRAVRGKRSAFISTGNAVAFGLVCGVAAWEEHDRSEHRSGFCCFLAIKMNRFNIMKLRPSIKIILGMALAGLLAAIVIPNYIKARTTRSLNTCIDINLRIIADAKTRWATDRGKSPGALPEAADLLPYLKDGRMPTCPAGGTLSYRPHRLSSHLLADQPPSVGSKRHPFRIQHG